MRKKQGFIFSPLVFWVFFIVVVTLASAIFLHYYRDHHARQTRQSTVADIALVPLPTSLPIVGPAGMDPDGYPLRSIDRAAFRSLLFHKKYSELTQYFEQIQSDFEQDYHQEYFPIDAADAFYSAEPELRVALNSWIAATPQSFAPYLARGTHWIGVAFARRGAGFINTVSQEDLATMRQAVEYAILDLEKAIALRPKLVTAQRRMIQAGMLRGDDERRDRAIDQALSVCPDCFQVRVAYIYAIRPRWGGSYDEMSTFAAAGLKTSKNSKLRLLPGYLLLDRADVLRRDHDYDKALQRIQKALDLGPHWEFLLLKAKIEMRQNNLKQAQEDLDLALKLRPKYPDLLNERARLWAMKKDWERAAHDLQASLQIDPTDFTARDIQEPIVNGLINASITAYDVQNREKGLQLLELAAEIDPLNRQISATRVSMILDEKPEKSEAELAAIERNANEHPDDFRAHQTLDYALSHRRQFKQIAAMWDRYIERNPNQGYAYLERSGTRYQLGQYRGMLEDSRKACELGVSEGCARAKQKAGLAE